MRFLDSLRSLEIGENLVCQQSGLESYFPVYFFENFPLFKKSSDCVKIEEYWEVFIIIKVLILGFI